MEDHPIRCTLVQQHRDDVVVRIAIVDDECLAQFLRQIDMPAKRLMLERLSFAGVLTFGSAEGLREALSVVPPELLLVETDAPYLTPKPHRGRVNATYLMPWTVRRMAEERGVDVADLCDQLVANTHRAFGDW